MPAIRGHVPTPIHSTVTASPEARPDAREAALIHGQLFRSRILHDVFVRCEANAAAHHERALARAGGDASLLQRMVHVLRDARLTVNFDIRQVDRAFAAHLGDEVANCFAFRERPGAPAGSSVGRARMEEQILGLGRLLRAGEPDADYGRFESESGTGASREFQWTSRPVYAALDFLDGPRGGAPTYGNAFLVLHDHVKHACVFSPVDTFSLELGPQSVHPDALATFFHLDTLVAHCQDDWFGYSCLKSLKARANGDEVPVHAHYGHGGRHNYIDVLVHARVLLHRDVKEIHLDSESLRRLSPAQQAAVRAAQARAREAFGREFILID